MASAQTAVNDELPDMALLEYLAELVEVDGELVGPQDMASAQLNSDKDEQETKPTTPKLDYSDSDEEEDDNESG